MVKKYYHEEGVEPEIRLVENQHYTFYEAILDTENVMYKNSLIEISNGYEFVLSGSDVIYFFMIYSENCCIKFKNPKEFFRIIGFDYEDRYDQDPIFYISDDRTTYTSKDFKIRIIESGGEYCNHYIIFECGDFSKMVPVSV